jgi:methyl-accepting chemotaxis protein
MQNGDVLVIGAQCRRSNRDFPPRWPGACAWSAAGVLSLLPGGSEEVNQRVQRIIAGDLREWLPHRKLDDSFSKLAAIVNGMLDEMETMINALAGVGQRYRPRSADAADQRATCA